MPSSPLQEWIRHLRRIARAGRVEEAGDGPLLERFVSRHDESAFEELMARHGPMVFGVCAGSPYGGSTGTHTRSPAVARPVAKACLDRSEELDDPAYKNVNLSV